MQMRFQRVLFVLDSSRELRSRSLSWESQAGTEPCHIDPGITFCKGHIIIANSQIVVIYKTLCRL